jgi:hypothetical protein
VSRSASSDEFHDFNFGVVKNSGLDPISFPNNRLVELDGYAIGTNIQPLEKAGDTLALRYLSRLAVYPYLNRFCAHLHHCVMT